MGRKLSSSVEKPSDLSTFDIEQRLGNLKKSEQQTRKSLKTSQIEARLNKLIEGTPAALKPPTIMDIEHRLKILLTPSSKSDEPTFNFPTSCQNSPNKAPF